MKRHREPLTIPDDHFEAEAGRIDGLTSREREVSVLVAEGLSNKQIGDRLFISPTTVRHHLTSIFRKLELSSRFELIVLCYRHRLVVPSLPARRTAKALAAGAGVLHSNSQSQF